MSDRSAGIKVGGENKVDSDNPERKKRRIEARMMVVSVVVALGFSAFYQGLANLLISDPRALAVAMVVQGAGFIGVGFLLTRSWVRNG